MNHELRHLLLKHPAHFFSLGFGSGLSPKAPGTCGSLAALPLVWFFWMLPFPSAVLVVLIAFVFGVWCTDVTAKAMKVEDPGAIVWDEIVGMLIAGLPLNYFGFDQFTTIENLGFLLFVFGFFRLFDIAKPFPVSWADQNFHGGFGIMLDDVLAGALASLVFLVLIFFS
jgi:phosphatidylglycerophosphatase A